MGTITDGKISGTEKIWRVGLETIRELEHSGGILASGREEIYGCTFGRDSLITSLKLLRSEAFASDPYLPFLVRKILLNLIGLLGNEKNIESGEEPGKCIHEFRTENHERLTQAAFRPWHVYPDGTMRNFDSLDATPLLLISIYRYWQQTADNKFLDSVLPQVKLSLAWILDFGDKNGDGFIDYQFHPLRKGGGLVTQSWMDSGESVFNEDGTPVTFPVAPVEVQSYCYLALRLWRRYFLDVDVVLAAKLEERAEDLKRRFNKVFVVGGEDIGLAAGLDGSGKLLTSVRSSMGHCLWAAEIPAKDGFSNCILDEEAIPKIAARLMQPDLFESMAGIRTLSKNSRCFAPNSYHNGSIWPHDCSMVAEGLENFGFGDEARLIRKGMMNAFMHFQTPLELYTFKDGEFFEYISPAGQRACRKQAWSAAALLADGLIFE